MRSRSGRLPAATFLLATLFGGPPATQATEGEAPTAEPAPAMRLAGSLDEPALRSLVVEILQGNPGLAAAAARARAAALEAPQVGALPDPLVAATAFLAPPETRVGPQRLMVAVSQRWPGFGKLGLRERAAVLEATARSAELEARRLELVTRARHLWYELAFVERQRQISEEFRAHLVQHEEIARTRYATGVGLGQGVVKLQAEITRVDSRLIGLGDRRAGLLAQLGALRDRPAAELQVAPDLPRLASVAVDRQELERRAAELRPELAAAAARIARAAALEELAEKERRPELTLGLTYAVVEPRDDPAGRLQPPAGNGDDVFGIQGGLALPVRRRKLEAGLEEARLLRLGADESRRAVRAAIAADLDELGERISLGWRQLRLLEDVLILQAKESLDSARAGYVAGTLNALDLLDAEHVLFGARTAVARAAADYAIYLARLEGVVAGPLEEPTS